MSLARSAPVQRDTPDPTSAPIRQVLNAFQGNANSSGTSTKAALDALRDVTGSTATPTNDAAAIGAATTSAAAASNAAASYAASTTDEAPPLPRPPTLPPPMDGAIPATPTNVAPFSVPATPAPTPGDTSGNGVDASPYTVVPNPFNDKARDPSSTSPGAASFAETPSSIGRGDDLDESDRRAIAPVRAFNIVAFLRTTRGMAIAGGAALVLVIVLVFAFTGGAKTDPKHAPVAAKKSGKSSGGATTGGTGQTGVSSGDSTDTGANQGMHLNADGTRRTGESGDVNGETGNATGETGGELAGSDAAAAGSDATSTTTATTAPTGETTTTTPAHPKTGGTKTGGGAKAGPTIGGKQVVLEYDNQAREAAPLPSTATKADQNAISKARNSYAAGNQRLFAGDADGAIRYYKEALAYYPAYVAGYRGLGLAYSQQGDKPAALKAFRTYVSSVPSAKDAGLIRKRITALGGK
ncbi:MAG TPA: tetratricopeptide repeat protein [Kofleriaceae bacterium]|nr:tetratricopeptide repeat protein [Kofleriaceae bacterium]